MTTHEEVIHATGHENVTAEHASTFEVTSDDFLTPAGDCILGIEADRVPADFAPEFVAACQDSDADIVVTLEVDGLEERIEGRGHPDLTMADGRSMVGRTSEYVDERTILVGADKAARDIDRDVVEQLAAGSRLTMYIRVQS